MNTTANYFTNIRRDIVGENEHIQTPFGFKPVIYLDWTASGRFFRPIEEHLLMMFGGKYANMHSESNDTGKFTTEAYELALQKIKSHVNANEQDVIICEGSGTTGVINKFIRMLGLRVPEQFKHVVTLSEEETPVVFLTHREHHSNHTSWLETIADVVLIEPNEKGEIEPNHLIELLETYKHRTVKIGSFTACSNVTGIETPYHTLAKIMHEYGGVAFVDFAASAPYVNIDMHPSDPSEQLDAIFFSPHKFLGGPGTSGVLVFNSNLYQNSIPDNPGGGTVLWTNRWGEKRYYENIEIREDGGTPGFVQVAKTALCIELKERMMANGMEEQKEELFRYMWNQLREIEEVTILDGDQDKRLGIISFYIKDYHYNLVVKMLNDRYGIQVRGGCSCAGTYGHYLLDIDQQESKKITDSLDKGQYDVKPGWVRASVHPTNSKTEIDVFIDAIKHIVANYHEWKKEYVYVPEKNEFIHPAQPRAITKSLFEF